MEEARIIELPKFSDPRGNLSFVEENNHIPFSIKRTYWIYDVPGGEGRGGHALRNTQEFIVAISGSFEVMVDNGHGVQTFMLNRSYYGLYIPKGCWRELKNFSTNSLALEFADTEYDRSEYIEDYVHFKEMKQHGEI